MSFFPAVSVYLRQKLCHDILKGTIILTLCLLFAIFFAGRITTLNVAIVLLFVG